MRNVFLNDLEGYDMIDTCRVKFDKLNFQEWVQIRKDIENHTQKKMNFHKEYGYLFTRYYKTYGIKKLILKNQMHNERFFYHSVELELHPIRFLRNDDYISLIHCNEIDEFRTMFNRLMKLISSQLPELEMWEPLRVDYAVQIYSKYTPLLIELFQKGERQRNLLDPYDPKQHRRKQLKGSFYLQSTDFVTINFYDKFDELTKKHPDYAQIEEAKGLLRFEVQCYQNYLRKMIFEDRIANKLMDFFTPKCCETVLLDYYHRLIGVGHYVMLKDGKEMIMKSKCKQKQKMIEILELVNSKRSIPKARKKYRVENNLKDNRKFDRYLNKIRSIGLNPVTFPYRVKGVDYIPNPLAELQKQIYIGFESQSIEDFVEELA